MNAPMRTIGRAVAAVAVALVVAGSTVGIAAATQRDDAVAAANAEIAYCFETGGDPVVLMDTTGESISVFCYYPSGNNYVCTWDPVRRCTGFKGISTELTSLIPVDDLPQLDVLDTSGGSAEPTAGPSAPDAQPRVAAPDDDQQHAKSKAGKKGKKHGHGRKGRK
jgi:putative hemolysin